MDRAPPRVRAEQGSGADALQRPLRSRFRARLTAGVRQHSLKSVGGFGFEQCDALVKSKAITYTSSTARSELPVLNNGGGFVGVQKMTGRKSPKPPKLETRVPDKVPLEKTGRITL